VNLFTQFSIAFIMSSLADISNARVTSGFASVKTLNVSSNFTGPKTSVVSPRNIFLPNLSIKFSDCVRSKYKSYMGLS